MYIATLAASLLVMQEQPVAATRTGNHYPFVSELPLTRTQKGLFLARVQVAGVTATLLVDTGATGSYLTLDAVRRLGLVATGVRKDVTLSDDSKVAVDLYRLDVMRLERVELRWLVIQAIDAAVIRGMTRDFGLQVDGILGADLMSLCGATLDYNRQVIRFNPQWAADLRRMQGRWFAVNMQTDGRPIRPTTRDNLRHVTLTVADDRATLDMSRIGSLVISQRMSLLVSHTPRRWASHDIRVGGRPVGGDAGQVGLYEFAGERLRFLTPSKPLDPSRLPPTVTAAVPESGLTLFTFQKVPSPPADGFTLLLGLARLTSLHDRPAHVGGWQFTLTPDWSLTGSHPGRKLRFTARLDGRVIVEPLD